MCGISGVCDLSLQRVDRLQQRLDVMNRLLAHRGPDDAGVWTHSLHGIGFAHRRLSIIDLDTGRQPMRDESGNCVVFNGEIYNYLELRQELSEYPYITHSDTEVILAAYRRWGTDCVDHFRGMFAFALWDEQNKQLFCARDRFGIKPFYYAVISGVLHFASEAKALLPFLPEIDTDDAALKDYIVFQLILEKKTLFKGVEELLPGHILVIRNEHLRISRYWEVFYNLDWDHTSRYFEDHMRVMIENSVRLHLRSDVPVGAYISGGIDSGIIGSLAARFQAPTEFMGFTGKFAEGRLFDESEYARALAEMRGMTLHEQTITARDFAETIGQVIYHLDYPVAGPGSFPQYHVSKLAAQHRKVVLGGQGGDEIFGGYVRYLIAYFEQCIKGAIDGTLNNGNFVVTYESIIPNLVALRNYKPLLKDFWKEGLFEDHSQRYYRLINRTLTMDGEVRWDEMSDYKPFETFCRIFDGDNVGKRSYFDKMTNFDFKTLLPALLQVEDRMSMAHGLESRVPFLDHPIVELAATIPSDTKFKDGTLKRLLVHTMRHELPPAILDRKDKMGFPVPLTQWLQGDLKDFVHDTFAVGRNRHRRYLDSEKILAGLNEESAFGRKVWGLLSLELWHQQFHDRAGDFRAMFREAM
jgi:asparagine synthase (glutamine-hydrolysing)